MYQDTTKMIFVILNLKEVLYSKDLVMEAVSYLALFNLGIRNFIFQKIINY